MDITFCEKTEYNVKIIDDKIEEVIEDKEEVKPVDEMKELTKRVISLSLVKMNKAPLYNTHYLNDKDKQKLQGLMREYETYTPEQIKNEFNEMMVENVFNNPNVMMDKLPIYDI